MTDLTAYRSAARAWIEGKIAEFGREARRGLTPAEDLALGRRYLAAKYEAGYSGISWPRENGGQGLSPTEKLAFDREEILHGFPTEYFSISLGMPVPIMLRYLPDGWKQERAIAALRGDEIWCQLFSEPAAGSDLAALRTRAVQDPDNGDWILNGQKLWTSWAHLADYGVIVARSDPNVAKHRGLTYFWVDMKAPGVTVRPVTLAAGDAHVNEVYFDDVRIPDAQRLGPVGGGFGVAMETLIIERYSATDPAANGPSIARALADATRMTRDGRPLIEDGRVRERIARNFATQAALASIHRRALLSLEAGTQPGSEGAIHKLVSVRNRQRLSEFMIDIEGVSGVRWDELATRKEDWATSWLTAPTGRIAGGADEMLLNTIAERILGLPQDHRPDKGVPFNEIPG
ncbi:acyl-CoA dehydrogenase family protein [Sphingopyxis chilensis]